MSEELKPCPFCGNKNIKIFSEFDLCEREEKGGQLTAICPYNDGGCGASGSYEETKEEATKSWNRRIK